jgi:hypothetical protein
MGSRVNRTVFGTATTSAPTENVPESSLRHMDAGPGSFQAAHSPAIRFGHRGAGSGVARVRRIDRLSTQDREVVLGIYPVPDFAYIH